MTEKYKAVLVGLGNIAWKFGAEKNGSSLSHAAAIQSNRHTGLVAGCSPNDDDRRVFEEAYQLPSYVDFEVMLDEVKPQLVSICSPTAAHYSQVSTCLKREIPMIWLEKPPAETAVQLAHLVDIQEEVAGVSYISVNFQRRYVDSYANMRKALQEQQFGQPRFTEIRYSRGLLTNGSHMLDMLFFVLAETKYKLLWVEDDGDPNNPSFALRLASGCLVIVSGCDLPYHNIDFMVTCDEGRISILHNDMATKFEGRVEHELFPGFYRLQDQGEGGLGKNGSSFSFDRALKDLIVSYERGRAPASNLKTALLGQKLLEDVLCKAGL